MQKPQLNNYFLALQNTYNQVEIGLFSCDLTLIAHHSINKLEASKELIPALANFLATHQLKLADIPFIVANQGPGPFTTLRVVISTINGLSFATGIPLIGVDALEAFYAEWNDTTYPLTVIMFNAFAFDVYVAIAKEGKIVFKGAKNIDQLLAELEKENITIRYLGNGATLYTEKIKATLGNKAIIPQSNPEYCSLEYIARLGYAQWQNKKNGVQQLLPLYLKQHPVQQKNPRYCGFY